MGHLGFAAAKGLAPFGTDVFRSAAAVKGAQAQIGSRQESPLSTLGEESQR